MTPNHAIFRAVYNICNDIHDNTFDYLPDANTKYPFVFVGENSGSNILNADFIGECSQTIHIYATRKQRIDVDEISIRVLDPLKRLSEAYGYYVSCINIDEQLLNDNTDVQPLLHKVLDVRFSFTRKD